MIVALLTAKVDVSMSGCDGDVEAKFFYAQAASEVGVIAATDSDAPEAVWVKPVLANSPVVLSPAP